MKITRRMLMAAEPETVNASDCRDDGKDFIADYIAAGLEKMDD